MFIAEFNPSDKSLSTQLNLAIGPTESIKSKKNAKPEQTSRRKATSPLKLIFMPNMKTIAQLVSKKKRRYQVDGFDLDLTYILNRVIAMGFPSENIEGIYRNSMKSVVRLLEKNHHGHYKVYNLCSERSYDTRNFHDRVAAFPFDDHGPPRFHQIVDFCQDAERWLDQHRANVAAVHCKAGKGRTGTMICCYLLHVRFCDTSRKTSTSSAEEALRYYGDSRTADGRGVTIASQRRYVGYYADYVYLGLGGGGGDYGPRPLRLHAFAAELNREMTLCVEVTIGNDTHQVTGSVHRTAMNSAVVCYLGGPMFACGDIKVEVYNKSGLLGGREKLFHVWFNSFFVHHGHHLMSTRPEQAVTTNMCKNLRLSDDGECSVAVQRTACDHYPSAAAMVVASFPPSELDDCRSKDVRKFTMVLSV